MRSLAQNIWHPCTQMKDFETMPPVKIIKAYGSIIETADGKKIIDATSSWWCKSLGHNHPKLKQALNDQADQFEHVIFANTTYDVIEKLSLELSQLMPTLNKVFYAGDGSCAVEIAMKMSVHFHTLIGKPKKTKFITLSNAYHGETMGALSVSDLGLYKKPYQKLLFEPIVIEPLYVNNTDDPRWHDATNHWQKIENILKQHTPETAAIIIEPILQAAGGMKLYSQDFLKRLAAFARKNHIHIIADEIMTGLGRTGKMLACEHANITPDFICLGKGLTSGWLPFSAVLTSENIYNAFYNDYDKQRNFLHSHTFSGNALGAKLALTTLNIIKQENLSHRAERLQTIMRNYMQSIAEQTGLLTNIRGIGAVIAADLQADNLQPRAGFRLNQLALKHGALLRPLGNTIYWTPPLNITLDALEQLYKITLAALYDFSSPEHRVL